MPGSRKEIETATFLEKMKKTTNKKKKLRVTEIRNDYFILLFKINRDRELEKEERVASMDYFAYRF